MTTAELLRLHREAAGMTQKALAEASGVSVRTLEKLEQGVIPEPKLITIGKIAAHLGKTCSDFMPTDLESETPSPSPAAPPPRAMGKRK